jgi:sugar lactone lactonase YvrE
MMKNHLLGRALVLGALLVGATQGYSQALTFTTTAGYAGQGSADGSGSNARFYAPGGLATDSAGNLYVADSANHTVRKISPSGAVNLLAGQAGVSGTNDGAALLARFNQPQALAVDSSGVVYVADSGNHTIRKIAGGVVSTLAGTPGVNGCADGTGAAAQFNYPQGLAVGSDGSLYVADTWNHTLRKVTAAGGVSTLAGAVGAAGSADGTNGAARFNRPQAVALDSTGNLYVADLFNHTVRRLSLNGTNWTVTTLAGLPAVWGGADGATTSARFFTPQGLAVDSAGTVYVAEAGNHTIRKITSSGTVSTLAGVFGCEGSADGVGGSARFRGPRALAVNGSTLYVADTGNGTIRQVTAAGAVTTLAGAPSIGTVDGSSSVARFYGPSGAAADRAGNLYVADTQNSTIRKITPAGDVTTFAGLAGVSGSSDGTTTARFFAPEGVAVDLAGNVYVADTGNHTLRKIAPNGNVMTLAGLAGARGTNDGAASSARFYGPQGVAVDANGNVYVADTWNHTLRLISATGAVTTLAGSPGNYGTADGTGASARFYEPQGLTLDAGGTLYVADAGNHTLRKVTSGGVVTTLAGSPGKYGSANGTGTNALFYGPAAVALDGAGNLYVADYFNQMLRKVTAGGAVTTLAGTAAVWGSLDGAATNALFCYPTAIASISGSAFYVADLGNNALRLGTFTVPGAPIIVAQPQSQVVDQGTPATFSVSASGNATLAYQWRYNTAPIAGATGSTFTRANVLSSDAGSYSVLVSNSLGSVLSLDAALVVMGAPVITVPPQDQVSGFGQNVTFSVGASGAQPLSCQWLFNGKTLAGATSFALSLTSLRNSDVGSYSVLVSNRFGTTVSPSAELVIAVMPRVWGDYSWGQTNAPLSAGSAVAIAAGAWHSLALQPEGQVVGWGNDSYGQCDAPATLTDALAIAAGTYHSLAVRADGTVAAWGSDDLGQTEVPSGLRQVIGVAGGRGHSLALRADGTVVAWGDNTYSQCSVPTGLSRVVSVAAAGNHSLALRANGTVVGWGDNTDANGAYSGQSVPPQGLSNVVAIAAGDFHSLAVLDNGQVVAWGDDSGGQCEVPADLTNAVAVAGGRLHTLALRADGTVGAWGSDGNGQCQVPAGLTNAIGIGAGAMHSVALPAGTEPLNLLLNPTRQGKRFNLLVQSLNRRHYVLECKDSLTTDSWTALSTNAGNGTLKQLSDTNAVASQRFYRLREW